MRARIAVIAALLATGLIAPSAASATAFAVTEGAAPSLVMFDPATPGSVSSSTPLTGLSAGEAVRGLDLRPATGALYLLTTDALGAARLRTVDPDSAAVTALIPLSADPADSTNPYTGVNFGNGAALDFNPVSDRLRILGPTGDNLRVNPANGFVTTDGAINGSGHTFAGAAYTNSSFGATTTTLYDVDYTADQLTIQNPPNDGTIVPVGSLGIIEQGIPNVAFDIAPAGTAYLAARVGGSSSLYTLNLTTGAATLIGGIGGGTLFRGFTIVENLIRRASGTAVATEGAAVARVVVERSSPRLGASVDYATENGSAVAGEDYEARAGTLTFVPGELAKLIEIPLRNDSLAEPTESFSVTLSNPRGDVGATATLAGSPTTTVTVSDDGDVGVPGGPGSGGTGGAGAGGQGPASGGSAGGDRTKPALLASADEIGRRGLRRRGLRVRFSCDETCTVKARLLAGRRAIATSTARLRAAGSSALRLKPTRRAFAKIGDRRRLKVALTATDAARNASRYAFRVRLL